MDDPVLPRSRRPALKGLCGWVCGAVFLVMGAAPPSVSAQTPYGVTHGTGTYTSLTGGTTHVPVAYGPFTNWDEGAAPIALPFDFYFYGVNYRTVYVYTNGFLSFAAPPSGGALLTPPSIVPSRGSPIDNFIGVLWGDLIGGPSPSIRSQVTGAVGARVVTIQVEGLLASNNANSDVNFQVSLQEGTNQIEVLYGRNFGLSSLTAAIENASGTDGANLMASSATCGAGCMCGPRQCVSTNFLPGKRITVAAPSLSELNASITAPNGAFPGTSFTAQVDLRNVGLQAAPAFRYELRLAPSNTSTAGSTLLRTVDVASLAASTTQPGSVSLTVPAGTPVGQFFVAIVVDSADAVVEAVESNNVAFSAPFVTGPDLQGTLMVGPETGPGEILPVQAEFVSAGAPVTQAFSVDFYLGTSTTRSPSDVSLGSRTVTLPDGFNLSQVFDLTVPLNTTVSPPPYYVLAEMDPPDAVEETDETNNIAASTSTLLVRGANLQLPSFDGGALGFRGRAYPVEVVVQNDGGAAARDFEVCVVLSDNPLISVVSDRVLLRTATQTLDAGAQAELRLEPIIPADVTTGAWFVAAVADCGDVVRESVETDNIARRSDAITVRDVAPDFTVVAVTTASASAAGETLPLSVRVANIGNASGEARVRVAISANPGITVADPIIYESPAALSLAPPEEGSVAGWGLLASTLPSGRYYVGALVDPNDVVDEVFEDNNVGVTGPITVSGSGLAIVTPPPPNAVIGVDYVRRFAAVGGAGGYAWTLEWTDPAPEGLSFDPVTAELSGVPAASSIGVYEFVVSVTSGVLESRRTYRLIVSSPTLPLTVVSSELPPALAQEPYTVQLIAVGGQPPFTWRLIGTAPLGLSVSADGELGGEPQVVEASTFEVEVRDAVDNVATGQLALTVLDPTARLTIVTADLPDGLAGSDYIAELRADGGAPPYEWTVEGRLPPGLTLDADQTAMITGTPTVAGTYPLVFEVRDQGGLLDRNAYVLDVIEEGALTILTGSGGSALPEGQIDQRYVDADGMPVRLRAAPADDLTWSIVSGRLPGGMRLTQDGILEGTPTESGAFAFLVLVTNSANDLRRATLALIVRDADPDVAADECSCRTTQGGASTTFVGWGLLLVGLVRWRIRRGAA